MSSSDRKKDIMVVDDQPVNLRLMETMLGQQGYSVRSFPRGRQALAAATQTPPDLILLDISMPEMDGFEVCRRLRSEASLAAIPVIFLSGLDGEEDKLSAFESGGFDYVTKPFGFREITARIETQLRMRELQAKVETQNHELEQIVEAQVREIAEGQMATIFALAKLADSRDHATGRHLERVQMLCRILAMELSPSPAYSHIITARFVQNIYHASPLHDIGKVAIPDSILSKRGKLTTQEYEVMKTHAALGAETLALVLERHPANSFVRMGIEIARSHHERWDGTGYPDGLEGTDIPLSARIMAVADCYDALVSERCYKEAFPHEESMEMIARGSGHGFDPEVVRAACHAGDAFRQVSDNLK